MRGFGRWNAFGDRSEIDFGDGFSFGDIFRGTEIYYDGNILIIRKPWWKGGGTEVYLIGPEGAEKIIGRERMEDAMIAAGVAVIITDPARGRYDHQHDNYDKARESAFENAGGLGENTKKEYDPATGTLVGEQSEDGKQGWRDDGGHFNWWDWTGGKKGSRGRYGHEHYPPEQTGPHSPPPSQKP
ncbi:MAG: hypothetical protein ACREIA_00395 [Opitutaceae bacterium]